MSHYSSDIYDFFLSNKNRSVYILKDQWSPGNRGREEQVVTCTIVELIALWATAVTDTCHLASTECTAGKNFNKL